MKGEKRVILPPIYINVFKMKKDLSIALSGIMAVLMLTGCGHKTETEVAPTKVKVMNGQTSAVPIETVFSGTVEEDQATSLSFATAGTVRQVLVSEGQRVSRGQLLAVVDDMSLRSAYASAKAVLTQAEDAYQRMKLLHDNHSLPDMQWAEVESKLEQARSMEAIARKNLSDVRLTAPSSGVISRKLTEVGQQVLPGMEVLRMIDVSRVKMKINIPEQDVAGIHVGQHATATVEALDSRTYDVNVSEVGTTANALTRSYDVKFTVANADGALRPGMLCTVQFALGSASVTDGGITVPASAVMLTERNTHYVWVITDGRSAEGRLQGKKAHRQDVTIGGYVSGGVRIQGVADGAQIITEGMQKVYEGCNVKVVSEP